MTVGDEGGRRRALNTLNTSEGQATRRMTKSIECVKHKRGGTVGDKETNQIYDMVIEAERPHTR